MNINRNFTLVLAGQTISLFGSAIQRFSLSLYLLELTGSAALYSNVLALSILPYIFLAPLAGMAADSFCRKKIMIALDIAAAALLAGYWLCFLGGIESAVLAGAVMFLLSAISACYTPAVTACLPQIVEKEKLPLANGSISQVGAFSNISGPMLAGILYGIADIRVIIFLNACSFFFSALLECLIHMPPVKNVPQKPFCFLSSYLHMGTTWKSIRKHHTIVSGIILSYGMYNLCIVPVNTILFPAVMNLELGVPSAVYGIVEGIITCGMLISGILVSLRPSWFAFGRIYLFNYPMPVMLCLMGMLLLLFPPSIYMIIFMAFGGMVIMFCLGIGNIITLSYTQSAVPAQMLGSVSALSGAIATGTIPLGQVLFGHLLESRLDTGIILLLSAFSAALVSWYVRHNIRRNL